MSRLRSSLALVVIYLGFFVPAVLAADPPKIKGVFPKEIAAGGPEVRVRVTGQRLKANSIIVINGMDMPTIFKRNEKDLLTTLPASMVADLTTLTVTVRNGTDVSSNSATIRVVPQGGLTIDAVRPRIVIADAPINTTLLVQGSNFDGKAKVRLGGRKTNAIVRRKGEFSIIEGLLVPEELSTVGSVPVQIENGNGQLSNTFNILIAAPAPDLDSIDPSIVDVGQAVATVKLFGANFEDTSKVFINNQLVPSVLKRDKDKDTKFLEVTVPGELIAQVDTLTVKVSNEGAGDSDILTLDVAPPGKQLFLYSLSPSSVPAGSKDFDLLVKGTDIQTVSDVFINGNKVAKGNIKEINRRFLSIKVRARDVASIGQLTVQLASKNSMSNTLMLNIEPPVNVDTIAGSAPGFIDGVGNKANFANPSQAVVMPDGSILIADQANHSIRRFDPNTASVTTLMGDPDGRPGYVDTADIDKDNPTLRFNNPIGLVVDSKGVVYVSDFGNDVIRRIRFDAAGKPIVDTVAGRSRVIKNDDNMRERVGLMGFIDDIASRSMFSGPHGMLLENDNSLLVADSFNNVIRRVTFQNGTPDSVSTVFGNGAPGVADGTGISVQFNQPTNLIRMGDQIMVTDFGSRTVRTVDMATNQVQVIVGLRRRVQSDTLNQIDKSSQTFGDGNRFFAVLDGPISAINDDRGNLYLLDIDASTQVKRSRLRRVNPDGTVTTIAGNGSGFADGPGIPKAQFREPRHLIFVGGSLLIVDSGNHRIRRVTNLP